jgi:hypothetical protein
MFESRIRKWGRIAAGALTIASATPALARNALTFDAAALRVAEGESFALQLGLELDTRSVGGGIHLRYDPAVVKLAGIAFEPGLGDDLDLRCPSEPAASAPVACPDPGLISFGSIDGLRGVRPVARLEFQAIGAGSSRIELEAVERFSNIRGAALALEMPESAVEVGGANGPDRDNDGTPDGLDVCPSWADPDQKDSDGDGRGNACECGDQNGDGTVDVSDLVSINGAIFGSQSQSPLCDANGDGLCDVGDIVAVNRSLFGTPTSCARHPAP